MNLKTKYSVYFPLSIACCNLLAAIFVMLKILRLSFAARIELVNNRCPTPVKTKTTTTRGTQIITMAFKLIYYLFI